MHVSGCWAFLMGRVYGHDSDQTNGRSQPPTMYLDDAFQIIPHLLIIRVPISTPGRKTSKEYLDHSSSDPEFRLDREFQQRGEN